MKRNIRFPLVALFILIGGILSLLFFGCGTIIKIGNGKHDQIILPNKVKVSLNERSKLKFKDASFEKGQSKVQFEGEAFFEVPGGKELKIETHLGSIKCKGGTFKAFARAQFFQVHCFTGMVEVTDLKQKLKHQLTGRKGIIHDAGFLFSEWGNLSLIKKPWETDNMQFHLAPLLMVSEELRKSHQIMISFPKAWPKKFSGELSEENLTADIVKMAEDLQLNCTKINEKEFVFKVIE